MNEHEQKIIDRLKSFSDVVNKSTATETEKLNAVCLATTYLSFCGTGVVTVRDLLSCGGWERDYSDDTIIRYIPDGRLYANAFGGDKPFFYLGGCDLGKLNAGKLRALQHVLDKS